MKLKEVQIKNYRQFSNSRINFESGTTVLAGANNSGKTSLIELFKNVFGNLPFSLDDIPVKVIKDWVDEFFVKVVNIFNEHHTNRDNIIEKMRELISDQNNAIEGIIVNLEVCYEKSENISRFADYLMDLDDSVMSIYFRYEFNSNKEKFIKTLEDSYEILSKRIWELEEKKGKQKDGKQISDYIKELIVNEYMKSFESKYYFTDINYTNKVRMDNNDFKNLFNIHYIDANRQITDEKVDKNRLISNEMINYVSDEPGWENLITHLPEEIRGIIKNTPIEEEIQSKSLQGLEGVVDEIAKTNNGRTTNIHLDFDIDNEAIKNLIKNITRAKYIVDIYSFKETAQGLGYSNLILIHLKLEKYIQSRDNSIVNIFIIEEPEAHMHPQMQKVFIEYLFGYYKQKKFQGLITTHSNEIVRNTEMQNIRVIRELEPLTNEIYDLNSFLGSLDSNKPDLKKFYSQFFNLNFSEMIFADRVIMYEGDTERMYIQSLLKEEKYSSLDKLYISYIQVGGAYAHSYKEIIEFLKIKTVIFTDIDYEKNVFEIEKILNSKSTNGGIKQFYKDDYKDENDPTIKRILEWKKEQETNNDVLIRIDFQTEKDGYARTLEEAMLSKLLRMKCEDELKKKDWEEVRKEYELKFSVPRENRKYYTREIVNSTSNSKTDFMYSVIHKNLVSKMLPTYIEEGLNWLMKLK